MPYRPNTYKNSSKNPTEQLRSEANLDHGIYVGEVIVRPKDESRSGRIPVYIPMLAKDREDPKGYFNCYWSSPFAGTSPSAKVGDNTYRYQDTMKTYGMWMVPPDPGNFVLVIFGDGKKKFPIIIGCLFPDQMQFMVPGNPAGVIKNTDILAPTAEKNRNSDDPGHGMYVERPPNPYIIQPILRQGLIKDPVRGPSDSSARRESPSQVYGILTPGPEMENWDTGKKDGTHRIGGHSFVMDDKLTQRHIRLRTAGGNQILMDDTNELIYIINKPGTAWVELAKDGSVHVFSDENFNVRATGNINMRADNTLNLEAGVKINIKAGLTEPASVDVELNEVQGDIHIEAGNTINSLTNFEYNVMTQKEGSIISHASKGQIVNDATSTISNRGQNLVNYAENQFTVGSGSSSHVTSSGPTYIKGATVHLNDGGGPLPTEAGKQIQPLSIAEFEDQPLSVPEMIYDHQNPVSGRDVGGNNGVDEGTIFPTNGDRVLIGDGDYGDPRGVTGGINVASSLNIITTREPWWGHVTQEQSIKGAASPKNQTVADAARRGDPGGITDKNGISSTSSPLFKAGIPDGVQNTDPTDGKISAGYGFQLSDGTQHLGTASGNINNNPLRRELNSGNGGKLAPLMADIPPSVAKNEIPMDMGSALNDFNTNALTDTVEMAKQQTPFDNLPKPAYDPLRDVMLTDTDIVGFDHVISPEEKAAGVMICGVSGDWGDKMIDPTSSSFKLESTAGKFTPAELSNIVRNSGPNQDLSRYGLTPKETGYEFAANNNSGGTDTILFNAVNSGISKPNATAVLKTEMRQAANFVATNYANNRMSKNQFQVTTLIAQSLGPSLFGKSKFGQALGQRQTFSYPSAIGSIGQMTGKQTLTGLERFSSGGGGTTTDYYKYRNADKYNFYSLLYMYPDYENGARVNLYTKFFQDPPRTITQMYNAAGADYISILAAGGLIT
jgi:hypothetical protein